MKSWFFLVFGVALILVATASAADLKLSTTQKDYYFPLGANGQISVNISNTYDHPLQGFLRSSVTESSQTGGFSMSSSYSQSQSYTAAQGESVITIDGGTSNQEKSLTIRLSFDYSDPTPKSQELGDITLHFVKDPTQATNTRQQVVSQSVTPRQGGPGQSSSSYQTIQQMVQQVGGTNQQKSLQENQIPQDSSALKQLLQAEQERTGADQWEFLESVNKDPTFTAMNESLAKQGYSPHTLDVNPESGDTGSFSSLYTRPTGEQVSVKGTLQNGTAREIAGQSTSPLIPPGPFKSNQTYQDAVAQLESEGYNHTQTSFRYTPAGSVVNQSYQNSQGQKAYLNSTSTNTYVTSVTVIKEQEKTDFMLTAAGIIILFLLAICAFLVYRQYMKKKPVPVPVQGPCQVNTMDFREEAGTILRLAERQYKEQAYQEAYGTAGQALRLFLSHRFGNGAEITNTEAVSLLGIAGEPVSEIPCLLDRCILVEFAKAEPMESDFEKIVAFIRGYIQEK